jgi:hypothetical protein
MNILQFKRLQNEVTKILGITQTQLALALNLLESIGPSLDCEWGTFWIVDSVHHELVPTVTWAARGVVAPKLETHTRNRRLSLSEGNAGHVWRTRRPIWTTDILTDMCLPRSIDAREAGLAGGVWFALKTDTAVYGVIEMLGRHIATTNEELLLNLESLGIQIGRKLEMLNV